MTDHDDAGMHEPFGPEYVRPQSADCPDCPCCTAALCEKGRASIQECAGHVHDELRATVKGCPCSSEVTRGTLAWRALRVRAVTLATQKPLLPPLEVMLKAAANGQTLTVSDSVKQLIARGLLNDAATGVTEYGRLYLEARTEARQPTTVLVVDVDEKTRTARVVLTGRLMNRPVTVPMDQLANGHTKLTPKELPGTALHAHANCAAPDDDDVVLTQVTNPKLPCALAADDSGSEGGR